ncbi:MAG: hypothetical protein RLZZ271_1169 [Pseudomonadota bacterium]|jgi:NADH dehydrogenase
MTPIQSAQPLRVLVTGGSGFVGRHVCEKLARMGCEITVPTRRRSQARNVQHLPRLSVVEADIHQPAQLQSLVRGHDAVVHLVAVLHGDEKRFEKVHVELVRSLVQACQQTGVQRLLHVSAIGVSEQAPSMYLRSKARGEKLVLESGLDVSVLRPSVIFGADDRFTNLFANLQQNIPLLPLAGAGAMFQPVWVQDVADALARLLMLPRQSRPQALLQACGPEALSLADIVRRCGQRHGMVRPVIPLPEWMGMIQARLMELLPGEPLMSRDNVRSMRVPNVASQQLDGLAALGIHPRALT